MIYRDDSFVEVHFKIPTIYSLGFKKNDVSLFIYLFIFMVIDFRFLCSSVSLGLRPRLGKQFN